ncbi:MarR family winged helix-turn-helix transcriptional regulator [Spirosoma soli]|uniref:MarR family winged helix-turn-helix transcriptional regulator n=1 Tax=Spirosoma soli TaxID=1770529 RepID=A0ABW5M176_9BACT
MTSEQPSIVPLIVLWERYVGECSAAGLPPDLAQFGGWLLRQSLPETSAPKKASQQESASVTGYDHVRLIDKIGMLIWRLSRFMRVSFKQHFEDHPLQSIDEFSLLAGAHHMQQPTKTQLFQSDLLEATTGTQMLARLIKQGLAEERVDPADRRQKRVALTAEGQTVYEQATEQMDQISDDLFHMLSTQELEQLESLLLRLNHYHTKRLENS